MLQLQLLEDKHRLSTRNLCAEEQSNKICKTISSALEEVQHKGTLIERLTALETRVLQVFVFFSFFLHTWYIVLSSCSTYYVKLSISAVEPGNRWRKHIQVELVDSWSLWENHSQKARGESPETTSTFSNWYNVSSLEKYVFMFCFTCD